MICFQSWTMIRSLLGNPVFQFPHPTFSFYPHTLPSSTLDLGSHFPSSSATLDQRKKSPRRMGETGASTGASSSSSMGRWSGCWVRDWWRYDRRRQTEKKTGLRVYRNTILDLEKRRRKMGIRRRKKGTREEGSKQEAAEKKKDSELV